MYFVIHNSVVLSKILKIIVPLKQNFENSIFASIKLLVKFLALAEQLFIRIPLIKLCIL